MMQDTPRKRGRPKGTFKSPSAPEQPGPEVEFDSDTEIDPIGEEKVTKDGYLLGGREYRLPTFTLGTSTQLYIWSLEASKLLGFRDTYIFFIKNPNVERVMGTEEDREYLRSMHMLPSAIRNRPIIMVRARNLFKVFGHKVVRRGRPVRDDYFVGDNVEPPYTDPNEEEDDDYADKSLYLDGPFRRHGLSVAGFPQDEEGTFEPIITKEMEQDEWMLKCAQSAAEFNHRLNRTRPTSFLDLHTNIEQVCQRHQPSVVIVEQHLQDINTLQIESLVNTSSNHDGWKTVGDTAMVSKYPVAVMKNQYQDQIPLFPHNFTSADVPNPLPRRIEPYDYLPNLAGVQPFIPMHSHTRKRARHAKMEIGYDDTTDICCHCHEQEAPKDLTGVDNFLTFQCSKCSTKHHPVCIGFRDVVLISKCMTYNWMCNNCKSCITCGKDEKEDLLMFCDVCDQPTHTFCQNPPMTEPALGSYSCQDCSTCQSCFMNSQNTINVVTTHNSNPQFVCTYCPTCYHDFQAKQFCPLCFKTYKPDSDEQMVSCDTCRRWIHTECAGLSEEEYQQMVENENSKFTCGLCDENRRDDLGDEFSRVVKYDGLPLLVPAPRIATKTL